MKILQINAVNHFGSTGRNTSEFHEYCHNHGIESHVFCMNESDEANDVHYVGTNFDHKLHALWSRLFGLQGYFSRCATKKMLQQFDKINPDAIILGNLHTNYVNIPMLLKYLAKKNIATVLVMHDCWFFTGHCTHYTSHKCTKWQSECKKCELKKAGNSSLFFDTSNKVFHDRVKLFGGIQKLGAICVSDWIANEARMSVILKSAKEFRRVYNWIDLNVFYPRDAKALKEKHGISDEFVVLGVATEWSWMKGLSHYYEAAKRLSDVKFILVGQLPDDPDKPSNVITPGCTTNIDELAEFYSMAGALLVCSLQETFGKVSAEALACGTPVIANNATANPEVAGAECGLLVENNNDDQIEAAIRKLMGEGKEKYTDQCVNRARTEFDKDTQISKYIEFVKSLI